MKIERTQAEDVSDIASRLVHIENSVLDVSLEVKKIVDPLYSSDGSLLTIPDRLDNISDQLSQIRQQSAEGSFQIQMLIWILIIVVTLLGFILWRVW